MRALKASALTISAFVMLVMSGCAADSGTTKAGGDREPVTVLRLGTDDFGDRPSVFQINEFARRVQTLSSGDLTIEPVFRAAGPGGDWDQRVARLVVSGELDMGLIPTRAWDTEDVTSMRALNAPFLIDTEELVADIVSGDISRKMLSGLDGAGVVGLALLPESLRHPFGLSSLVLGPDDYAGNRVRSPRSDTVAKLFEALGATVTDGEFSTSDQVVAESAYLSLGDALDAPYATGNVTFFPKINSLVANEEAFANLTDVDRDILRTAAEQTRQWAIETGPRDLAAAAEWCDTGRTIVHATSADLAALHAMTAPVYDWLRQNPETAALIDEIQSRKTDLAIEARTPPTCGSSSIAESSQTVSTTDPSVLNGVYRFEITEDDIRAAGIDDPANLEQASVFTWTFDDGEWCWDRRSVAVVVNRVACATYTVDGNVLTVFFESGPSSTSQWEFGPNRSLRLTIQDDGGDPLVAIAAKRPWVRIDDLD